MIIRRCSRVLLVMIMARAVIIKTDTIITSHSMRVIYAKKTALNLNIANCIYEQLKTQLSRVPISRIFRVKLVNVGTICKEFATLYLRHVLPGSLHVCKYGSILAFVVITGAFLPSTCTGVGLGEVSAMYPFAPQQIQTSK